MDGSWRFRPLQRHLCSECSTPHFPLCQMPMQMPQLPHAFDHYCPEFRRFHPGPAPPFSHRPPLWDHHPPPPRLHPPETWGVNRALEGEIFRPFIHLPQRFPQDEFLGGETSYKRMRVEEPPLGIPHLHPSFDRNEFVPGRISVGDERRLNLIRDHGKLNEGMMQSEGEFLPDRFARDGSQSQPRDARVDRVSDGSKFNSVGKSVSILPLETISFSPNKVSRPSQFEGHQSFKGPPTSYGVERYAFCERLDFERIEDYDTYLGENRIGCEKSYSADAQVYPNARHNQYDGSPTVIHNQHDVSFQQRGCYRDNISMPNTRYNAAHVADELPFSVKRQQATHNTLNYLPRDQFEQNDRNDFPEIHAPKDYPYALPNAENPEQVSYQLAREKSSYPAFGDPTGSRFDLPIQQTDALGFPYETKVPDICDTQRPLKPLNYPLSEKSSSENFVVQGCFSNSSSINDNAMSKDLGRMHTPGVHLSLPPSLPATHVPVTSSPLTVPPPALFPVLPNASAITSIPTNRKYPDPHALPQSIGYIQQPPPVEIAKDLPLIHQVPPKHFPGAPTLSTNHSINAKPTVVNACDLFKQPLRASRPDHIVIILRGLPGSGKSYLAKALHDIEIKNGGNAPRIHAMDDYFMVEVEKNIDDNEGFKSTGSSRVKKQTTKKVIEYCYEPEMEEAYRLSMLKAFKKTLEEAIFTFIIVDDRNLRVADFAQFWAIAKRSGYEVYLLEAPYKDPMGCAARNVHGFTLEDIQKMAEKWEKSPPLYVQIDIQSLFHGDDLNEKSIQEVDMDINDSDCDNNKAKLLEESLKSPESKRENSGHRQDSPKHAEKWEFDEEEEWKTRIRELGSSKWSKDLDEEDKKLEGVGKNINALSGLMHAYNKGGKSVHWGDQLNKSGFSIGTVKKHSLIIGPGSGYNLASNPIGENQDIAEAAKTSNTRESKRQFSEKLRAEHESIRDVLSKRRQRIGGLFRTEYD